MELRAHFLLVRPDLTLHCLALIPLLYFFETHFLWIIIALRSKYYISVSKFEFCNSITCLTIFSDGWLTDRFVDFFYFFLLHATFIPVSLYVSMSLIRSLQSYFMQNDLGTFALDTIHTYCTYIHTYIHTCYSNCPTLIEPIP